MEEREWYSVLNLDGEKTVHYHGWCWLRDDGEWSFVELTGCYVPLSELAGEDAFERLSSAAETSKQYQWEHPKDVAETIAERYYGSGASPHGETACEPGRHLDWEDLDEDTPCGDYWSHAEPRELPSDREKLEKAWSGRGVYSVQYAEERCSGLEPVDRPRKFHACDFGELWDQHDCWVGNDAMDLVVLSVKKLPPDGMAEADLRRALDRYEVRKGALGADARKSIEEFIRFAASGE